MLIKGQKKIFLPVLSHAILDYPYEKQSTGIYFTVILTIYSLLLLLISTYEESAKEKKADI